MTAGESIEVGSGAIRTTGGGEHQPDRAGRGHQRGHGQWRLPLFPISGYSVSPTVGGIATAAGGDVTLTAGDDIISTPTATTGQAPGASGAYGSEPGNVTLTAGNEVLGNFTVANGTGTILAGVQCRNGQPPQVLNANASIGTSSRPVSLSLIDGSWNVWSGGNIYISEVRNPNGTFNSSQLGVPGGEFTGNIGDPTVPSSTSFLFDYAANAAANFWAGDGITLTGANLPRSGGRKRGKCRRSIRRFSPSTPGREALQSIIRLFFIPPARAGCKSPPATAAICPARSSKPPSPALSCPTADCRVTPRFGQGNALTPLYENNPNPVDAEHFRRHRLLRPDGADVRAHHRRGQHLQFWIPRPKRLAAANDLHQRGREHHLPGDLTSVSLTDPLPAAMLNAALSGDPAVTGLLSYNAATGTLTFIGQMTAAALSYLLNPTEVVLNSSASPS
jgi:hypothetical protein